MKNISKKARILLTKSISRLFASSEKRRLSKGSTNNGLARKVSRRIRKYMNHASVNYDFDLLFSSARVTLYFALKEGVEAKDLAAAITCFDEQNFAITEVDSLPFSSVLGRHYIYLRPQNDTGAKWVQSSFAAKRSIKRIEIEVVRWNRDFQRNIEDVLSGVWVGETMEQADSGNSVNFVAMRGAK